MENSRGKLQVHEIKESLVASKITNLREYWRLYKERYLESEREFNYVGRHLVGGIEVHEENFEYLVVEQIEDKKDCNE